MNIMALLTEVEMVKNIAIGIILLYSIVDLFFIKKRENDERRIKIFGAIIILVLSLSAKSPFVYGVAVFVIATFITEIGFLENLAGIMKNSKEYFDYKKIKLVSSTEDEQMKKIAKELLQEQRSKNTSKLERNTDNASAPEAPEAPAIKSVDELKAVIDNNNNNYYRQRDKNRDKKNQVLKALDFEKKALKILRKAFEKNSKFYEFSESMKMLVDNDIYEIDGIVTSSNVDFIVEVKYSSSKYTIHRACKELEKIMNIYRNSMFKKTRFKEKNVHGIILRLENFEDRKNISNNNYVDQFDTGPINFRILELIIDENKEKIINQNEFEDWLFWNDMIN